MKGTKWGGVYKLRNARRGGVDMYKRYEPYTILKISIQKVSRMQGRVRGSNIFNFT